jgi:hypothetical protein
MKFEWLNKQGVRSDTGIELQFIDRHTLDYREVDLYLRLQINSEILISPSGRSLIVFSREEMRSHWAFHTLPIQRQEQVELNLLTGLDFQGLEAEFE